MTNTQKFLKLGIDLANAREANNEPLEKSILGEMDNVWDNELTQDERTRINILLQIFLTDEEREKEQLESLLNAVKDVELIKE